MKAGRELDALIAENVMGWKWDGDLYIYNHTLYTKGHIPHYSTNIADAWLVVEQLREKCHAIEILMIDKVYVEIRETAHVPFVETIGDSVPLTICLAALKACGVE